MSKLRGRWKSIKRAEARAAACEAEAASARGRESALLARVATLQALVSTLTREHVRYRLDPTPEDYVVSTRITPQMAQALRYGDRELARILGERLIYEMHKNRDVGAFLKSRPGEVW